MDVTSASSILFNVREHPSVKAAQVHLDDARKELDKVEVSRKGDFGVKQANFASQVDQFWETNQYAYRQPVGTALLLGVLACGVGASHLAALVPALKGLQGLALIGGLVGGWKLMKRAGPAIMRPLLQRSVNKSMNRWLDTQKVRAEQRVQIYQQQYDNATQSAMHELTAKAAAAQQAREAQRGSTEVKVEEQQVRLGGIVVPRRAQEATVDVPQEPATPADSSTPDANTATPAASVLQPLANLLQTWTIVCGY